MTAYMTYRIMHSERAGILSRLAQRRGTPLTASHTVGQRVTYRGIPYTILDHMADGNGSTPVLLSDHWDVVHGVAWTALRPTTL